MQGRVIGTTLAGLAIATAVGFAVMAQAQPTTAPASTNRGGSIDLPIGREVEVKISRAVASSGPSFIGVSGKLLAADERFLYLSYNGGVTDFWVPRECVLYIAASGGAMPRER